jgi:hypothetical protein
MRRSAYDDGKAVFPLPRILMTIATRRSEPVTFALPQNMGQMLKRSDDSITNVETKGGGLLGRRINPSATTKQDFSLVDSKRQG